MRTPFPLCCAALLLPAFAGAWEVKAADADRRIREVQVRWKTAQGEPVIREVLRGARQGRKPGWARKVRAASDKVCWSESHGGKTYYFGVGLVQKVKNESLRVTTAQDRARASLLELLDAEKTAAGQAEGLVAEAIPIDWYGDRKGSLYALLVVVRSRKD
jgi:hypothetical protein